jgi:hypothetical protein
MALRYLALAANAASSVFLLTGTEIDAATKTAASHYRNCRKAAFVHRPTEEIARGHRKLLKS